METGRAEPYLKKKCGFAQMFVGREGTGSPLHNAGTANWFYMVDGVKRWYLIGTVSWEHLKRKVS